METKFKEFINYIEEHLHAFIFLAVALRVVTYFIEVIRRCVRK